MELRNQQIKIQKNNQQYNNLHTDNIDHAFVESLPALTLTLRQLCDIELLLNGGFAPLTQFMDQQDYLHVLQHLRLRDGNLWPMPIMFDVDQHFINTLENEKANTIALRDAEGLLIAILDIKEHWKIDKAYEAYAIYGTTEDDHPGVAYLYHQTKDYYISGKLQRIALPHHYDFKHLRHTPAELHTLFQQQHWQHIVAFQTRNPMHRAHQELTVRAAQQTGAKLLLHPVVGMTKPGDIEYYTRVRCYEHILQTYAPHTARLSLLPLAMRMAGPREAVWHALIRKNYGCTHFIVGRDHAGPGKNRAGIAFYDVYAAQELALTHQQEMGIHIIPFQEMVYSHQQNKYFPVNEFPQDETPASISGTELRESLQKTQEIPAWFSFPAVITELRKAYPPRSAQGFTIFLTGLPSSGKSTIANALVLLLREINDRQITLLDGDVIRTHLSKGLGFSEEDRETNLLRVGFVAKEITRHGGIAICALVAPYENVRAAVKNRISAVGGFIEIYVATPLAVCETRDRKGLYKQARAGKIPQFTGVSDPYESPLTPDIKIDTSHIAIDDVLELIIKQIKLLGYIR